MTVLLKDKVPVGDKVLFIGGGQSSCEAAYDLVLHGKHPIIAMTANAFDDDVEKSRRAGMNAHLAKPIDAQRLYATLADLISRRPEQAAKV